MALIRITDAADPLVEPYRDIRERDLVGRQGRFLAEGEVVLRVLAARAPELVESLLIAESRLAPLADLLAALPEAVPVLVAPQALLDGIAGFAVHRGVIGLGRRPSTPRLDAFLAGLPERALLVVAVGIANHDNMGGIFRNAAAFGADGVLLDDTCCDPLYRKAIRVSVGGVFAVPFLRGGAVGALVEALAGNGFECLALTPGGESELVQCRPAGRTALILGAEGPGLPAAVLQAARGIRITMSGGFDSLNVATCCGIALHHLRHGWRVDAAGAGAQ